ncbi:hypothetical protein [uncultured Kordia sp.]|uniref:hypothetical protein n=1 Tax=uncultured Kordia sp. TaxID=507699 RepID=UPI00262B13CE|nr:hypothetical protein [uncultured Kordia sp.]
MNHQTTLEHNLVETPGKLLTTEITVSSPILIAGEGEQTGQFDRVLISLSEYETNDLFPPCVMAYHETGNGIINVNAMVLLPVKEIDPSKFAVTQQFVYSEGGKNQLNLHISYYANEATTNKYIPILISFKTDPVYRDGSAILIDCTQTFFKNIDPKTSRGTITTVKRPM